MDFVGLLVQLIVDTSASWLRMFIALAVSILISVFVGIYAATNKKAEHVILPVVDILQTVPILAFFPFAIYVFVAILPGFIGINAAVIFLIITSMLWNIIFGVYESVKTIPKEFDEVARIYNFDFRDKLRKIYIPAALPRIVEQSILSWSIGLFYLVTSEIFSIGNANYTVKYGIGSALITLSSEGAAAYATGLLVFIAFVVATRFLFFRPLENYANRYTKQQAKIPRVGYERVVIDWLSKRVPRRIVVIDDVMRLRPAEKPSRVPQKGAEVKMPMDLIYKMIAAVIIIGVIIIFATNKALLNEELGILPSLAASFVRVWFAFAVVLIIAVPLCIYMVFMSKQSPRYLLMFQVIASIPATVLLPAIVSALQKYPAHSELTAFVVFVLSGIWYVIFSVMASTRSLPKSIFEVQKIFGVKGRQAWKEIYMKAITPGLITGAVTAIAAEWNASIVAEYFTTSGVSGTTVLSSVGIGIGKLLDTALAPGGAGLGFMMLALINLVVVIILINTFVWKRLYNQIAKMYG